MKKWHLYDFRHGEAYRLGDSLESRERDDYDIQLRRCGAAGWETALDLANLFVRYQPDSNYIQIYIREDLRDAPV